jgi:hypothetical protein
VNLPEVQRYVDTLVKLMKLGEWEVEVHEADAHPGGAQAWVHRHNDGLWSCGEAHIHIVAWDNESPEERRRIIVHELLHLHLAPFSYMARKWRGNWGDEMVAEEMMIERLTSVIAPHMPLPDEVERDHVDALASGALAEVAS